MHRGLTVPIVNITSVDIPGYSIVSYSGDGIKLAKSKEAIAGVTGSLKIPAGECGDVTKNGIMPILFSGSVKAGELVASDGEGCGKKAVQGDTVLGYAHEDVTATTSSKIRGLVCLEINNGVQS